MAKPIQKSTAADKRKKKVYIHSPSKPQLKRLFVIGFLVILGFLYLLRSLIIVAVVDGEPIYRLTVIHQLEKQKGEEVLRGLVSNKLVSNEAERRNITVDQKEIDLEFKKIDDALRAGGQSFDTVIAARGLTQEDVEEQIRIQKLGEKMIGSKVVVTEAEVNEYIEKNKSMITKEEKENPETLKESIKDQLRQQKLAQEFTYLVEELQRQANIFYFVQY